MTFRRVNNENASGQESGTFEDSDREAPSKSHFRSLAFVPKSPNVYSYETLAYSGSTLPRRFGNKWNTLTQSSEPIRTNVVLEKNADEAFGFEIQTYGLHHPEENSVEMCTFVCRVHDQSPAQLAGLKVGHTITCVNETSVQGCQHKDIVQLIKSSGNTLRLEMLYSDTIRRAELDARLQYLRQILHEKWDEYRSLMVQEQRLTHGIVMSDAVIYESLESAGVYGSLGFPSPITIRAQRLWEGSNSSSTSHLSAATDEDVYQDCLYHGNAAPKQTNSESFCKLSRQLSNAKRLLHPAEELFASARSSLTRSASVRSYFHPSGKTASLPSSNQGRLSLFLQKPKPLSFPKILLKFIPGLNHTLEEEESKL